MIFIYVRGFGDFFGRHVEIKPGLIAVGNYELWRARTCPYPATHILVDYTPWQTNEMWKVVNVLADMPTVLSPRNRSETRAQVVGGGAPARPNRVHENRGPVRRQSADGVLRAHFQG